MKKTFVAFFFIQLIFLLSIKAEKVFASTTVPEVKLYDNKTYYNKYEEEFHFTGYVTDPTSEIDVTFVDNTETIIFSDKFTVNDDGTFSNIFDIPKDEFEMISVIEFYATNEVGNISMIYRISDVELKDEKSVGEHIDDIGDKVWLYAAGFLGVVYSTAGIAVLGMIMAERGSKNL